VEPPSASSAARMAAATALSRATGFARTMALAWALGATALGDAYNVANTAPNMIFQLAAGGVLSSAVVPLLVRATGPRRREAASSIYGLVLAGGAFAAIVVLVSAPLITGALLAGAAGRADFADTADVATTWLRLFALQVPLYGLGVLGVGVMTAHRRLTLGAAASVLTNLITIAGALAFVQLEGRAQPPVGDVGGGSVVALGAATTAGVAAMSAVQLWGAHRVLPGIVPRLRVRDETITRLVRLAPWVVLYVVVNQVGLAAVTAIASTVPGGVSAYQWSFTIMQLPYAVVSVSLISAAFPRIADAVAAGADVSGEVTVALRPIIAALVPAAAVLLATAPAVGRALVGTAGGAYVAAGVAGFAASLVPFSVFQLLTRTSYAFEDTRAPALVNVAVNAINVVVDVVVLALTEPSPLRVAGLGLGHAASYVGGCVLLGKRLQGRGARVLAGLDVLPQAAVRAAACGGCAWAIALPLGTASQLEGLLTSSAAAAGAVGLFVMWHLAHPARGLPVVRMRSRGRRTTA